MRSVDLKGQGVAVIVVLTLAPRQDAPQLPEVVEAGSPAIVEPIGRRVRVVAQAPQVSVHSRSGDAGEISFKCVGKNDVALDVG